MSVTDPRKAWSYHDVYARFRCPETIIEITETMAEDRVKSAKFPIDLCGNQDDVSVKRPAPAGLSVVRRINQSHVGVTSSICDPIRIVGGMAGADNDTAGVLFCCPDQIPDSIREKRRVIIEP